MAKSRRCRGIDWHDRPASRTPCRLPSNQCLYIHPEEIPLESSSKPHTSPSAPVSIARGPQPTMNSSQAEAPLPQKRGVPSRSVSPVPRRRFQSRSRSPPRHPRHHLPPTGPRRPHSPPIWPDRGRSPARPPPVRSRVVNRGYECSRSRSPRGYPPYYYPSRRHSPHRSGSRSRSKSRRHRAALGPSSRGRGRSPSPRFSGSRQRRRSYQSKSRPSSPDSRNTDMWRTSQSNPTSSQAERYSKSSDSIYLKSQVAESPAGSTAYSEHSTNPQHPQSPSSSNAASFCQMKEADAQSSDHSLLLIADPPRFPFAEEVRMDHRDSVDTATTRYETKEEECEEAPAIESDMNELRLTLSEAILPVYLNDTLEVEGTDMDLDSNYGQDMDMLTTDPPPEDRPDMDRSSRVQGSDQDQQSRMNVDVPEIFISSSMDDQPLLILTQRTPKLSLALVEANNTTVEHPEAHVIPPHIQSVAQPISLQTSSSTSARTTCHPLPSPTKLLYSSSTLELASQQSYTQFTRDQPNSTPFEHLRGLFKPMSAVIRLRQEWDEAHKKVAHYQKALADLEGNAVTDESHILMPMTPGPSNYGVPPVNTRCSTRDPRLAHKEPRHVGSTTADKTPYEDHGSGNLPSRSILMEKLAGYQRRLAEAQDKIKKEMGLAEKCWQDTVMELRFICEQTTRTTVSDALQSVTLEPPPLQLTNAAHAESIAELQKSMYTLTSRMNAYEDMERSGLTSSQDHRNYDELLGVFSDKVTKLQKAIKSEMQEMSSTMSERLGSKYDTLDRKIGLDYIDLESRLEAKIVGLDACIQKNNEEANRKEPSTSGSPSKKRKRDEQGKEREKTKSMKHSPSEVDHLLYQRLEETIAARFATLEAENVGLKGMVDAQDRHMVEIKEEYNQEYQSLEKRLAMQQALCHNLTSAHKIETRGLRKDNKELRKELDITLIKSELKHQERYNRLESQIDMMSKIYAQVQREMDSHREEQIAGDKERDALRNRIAILEQREAEQSAAFTQCEAGLSDIKAHLSTLLDPWKDAMEKLEILSSKDEASSSISLSPAGHNETLNPHPGSTAPSTNELTAGTIPPSESPELFKEIFSKLIELGTLINQHAPVEA